jgi:hypothetical protein
MTPGSIWVPKTLWFGRHCCAMPGCSRSRATPSSGGRLGAVFPNVDRVEALALFRRASPDLSFPSYRWSPIRWRVARESVIAELRRREMCPDQSHHASGGFRLFNLSDRFPPEMATGLGKCRSPIAHLPPSGETEVDERHVKPSRAQQPTQDSPGVRGDCRALCGFRQMISSSL